MALPLGTTPLEIANAVAVAVALGVLARDRDLGPLREAALAGPAAALALGWLLLAFGPGGSLQASVGRVWALAPFWTVPVLLAAAERGGAPAWWLRVRPEARDPEAPSPSAVGVLADLGVTAALVAVAWVAVQVATGALPPSGPYSHHLTLAYALLPAFAAALGQARFATAAAVGMAILATGSAGAAVALATTAGVWAVAGRGRLLAGAAAAAGIGAALAGMATPWFGEDIGRRAVLWTGAARVAVDGGTPPGTWRDVIAPVHRDVEPGFDFPHHAHDTAIQAAADAGPAAWIALSWGAVTLWRHGPGWLLAAAAGLAVGGLTQDLIGDLEVVRAFAAWASLGLVGTVGRGKVSDGSP